MSYKLYCDRCKKETKNSKRISSLGCGDLFIEPKHFSDEYELCENCYKSLKKLIKKWKEVKK